MVAIPEDINNNQKTVTAAGTAEKLSATSVPCSQVTIKSLSTNSGIVYVGNADVSSTTGYELAAANSEVTIPIDDASKVYVDVASNGEGVSWIAS